MTPATGRPAASPAAGQPPAPPDATEPAGAGVALANLPDARRTIVTWLKKRGPATVEDLARATGTTVSAVRQHLRPMEAEGLVAHELERPGPGRPRHRYRLAPGAEVLFPKRYGDLTNQLLGFIEDADPGLVERAFERRQQARTARAASRLAGKAFDQRVRELATILDEDGYLADYEQLADGTWRIVEHNCAILDVARQHGSACTSEIAFLRDALPDADIERVAHMIAGAHACAYEIRPLPSPTG